MAQPEQDPIYDDQKREPTSALDKARARWGMSNDENTPEVEGESQQTSGEKSSARDRADKRWGMGTAGVGNEEAQASPLGGNGLEGAMNNGEKDLSAAPSPIKTSFTPDKGGFLNQGVKLFGRNIGSRKKVGGAVGGVAGLGLLVAVYMAGASLYLVHLREYVTGANNQQQSAISNQLQRRRLNSTFKLIRKAAQKVHVDKFASKARQAGFEVAVKNGAVESIARGVGADRIIIEMSDKSDKQLAKIVKDMAAGVRGDAGITFINEIDNVSKEVGSRFLGPVVKRKVYKKIFGLSGFYNWIDARTKIRASAGTAADETPVRQLSDAMINADSTQRTIERSLSANDAARIAGAVDPNTATDDILQANIDEANKAKQEVLDGNTGNYTARVADGDAVAANIGEAAEAFGKGSTDELTEAALAVAPKLSSRIGGKVLGSLGKSFDAFTVWREGCRVRGTLAFVKSMRNTLVFLELVKFGYKFYTIADHQKAGLASSTSIKLMSIYLAGAAGSSGIQSIVAGGAVSGAGIQKYGVGYADVGILAAIATFLSKVPGLEPGQCKLVNSPIVMGAGVATGAALSFFSLGSLPALNLSWSAGLTLANEVAFAVVLPIMLGTLSGALINGLEKPGEDSGTALGAAVGAHSTTTASASAALPITSAAFEEVSMSATVSRDVALKSQSFAERYLDLSNSDSLMARASLYVPQSIPGIGSIAQKQFNFSSISNPFSSVLSLFSKSSSALSNKCEDVTVQKYDLATDGFCSPTLAYVPVLDLDQTQKILTETTNINLAGQPIPGSDLDKFIENCFSGRAGILHPIEVNQDGSTDPIDPTCVVGVSEGPYTGHFDGDLAEEAESGQAERVPLIKERFAAWYGWLVDEENLAADINDQLSGANSATGEANNNNIFFLGDSLTVGMQNLAGSDPQSNYLQRSFNSEGWSTSVDAKGCRAVYQTQGSFEGDGSSCPAGTINDGISAVNDPANAQYLNNDEAGTVVIGLGTNQYETDANGRVSKQLFEEKVKLLVSDIRKKSPNAEIYWVNLVNNSESTSLQERNLLINKIAVEDNFTVLDWNDYVSTAKSTPTTEDDVGFATEDRNEVHHTADGYTKKVQYLIDNVILPAGNTVAGTKSLNCSGYKEVTSPESRVDRAYSAEIQNTCEEMKTKCQSGVADTERILCSAFEFDGTYYGNSYGAYSGANGNEIYGFNVTGNFGLRAKDWLDNRSEGLSPNNLLECSGLTSVSLFRAYGVDGVGCSGNWTERANPALFREVTDAEIRPGDFLTKSFGCNSDASNSSGGHVAIAASAPDANGNIIVYETDSWEKPVRFTKKNLSDFPGGHSRYIGTGTQ